MEFCNKIHKPLNTLAGPNKQSLWLFPVPPAGSNFIFVMFLFKGIWGSKNLLMPLEHSQSCLPLSGLPKASSTLPMAQDTVSAMCGSGRTERKPLLEGAEWSKSNPRTVIKKQPNPWCCVRFFTDFVHFWIFVKFALQVCVQVKSSFQAGGICCFMVVF